MTLSDFIESNLSVLIDDWTHFARALSNDEQRLTELQLRDSARELLLGIAADMREPQTGPEQKTKSLGGQPDPESSFNRIAHRHADDRLAHGFGISPLIAEYRALRASVLHRWQTAGELYDAAFQEMIRFNEAIDQMVAESVRQYAQRTERIRDLFAGVLAHDMRSPVAAILDSTQVLLLDEHLSTISTKAGANVQRSGLRLKQMIDDLFTFTRARLGDALALERTPQDLGRICQSAADEVRAACPDCLIDVKASGDLSCYVDGDRINQLLVNLLTNAVRHGTGSVGVVAAAKEDQLTLAVSNGGAPIPPSAQPTLFDPLIRANSSGEQKRATSGMGLGLYICRSIVLAHGGAIHVESTDNATTFAVQLPRTE